MRMHIWEMSAGHVMHVKSGRSFNCTTAAAILTCFYIHRGHSWRMFCNYEDCDWINASGFPCACVLESLQLQVLASFGFWMLWIVAGLTISLIWCKTIYLRIGSPESPSLPVHTEDQPTLSLHDGPYPKTTERGNINGLMLPASIHSSWSISHMPQAEDILI